MSATVDETKQVNSSGTQDRPEPSHSNSDNVWIVDSGAANHITHESGKFSELTPYMSDVVIVTGERHPITHIGTVRLPTSMLTIRRVFYVPSFKYNLLSVSRRYFQAMCVFTPSRVFFRRSRALKEPILWTLLDHLVCGD